GREVGVGPERSENLSPVHLRHEDVTQDEVGPSLLDLVEARLTVGGVDHVVPLGLQQPAEVTPERGLIFDDENEAHEVVRAPGSAAARALAWRERRTQKVVPCPGAVSTVMTPSWRSTTRFTMLSPRPVPERVSTFDARWNGVKRYGRSAAGMP